MGRNTAASFFKKNRDYACIAAVILFSTILYHFAYLFEERSHYIFDVATYLTWHSIFEFIGILVCFAVFVVAYYTYDQNRNFRFIFMGSIFFTTGIIDFFHTLSYKGMPDFFVANYSANRATTFWIIARLIMSIGLAISSFLPYEKEVSTSKWVFPALSVVLACSVLIIVTYFPHLLPPMYLEDKGLTGTKIALEYFIIALFLGTMVKFFIEYKTSHDFLMMLFICALILNIFCELAFTAYNKVYDIYNYIGHVYKFIAYFIIFRIIFIYNVQKPYKELFTAQEKLKDYARNLDRLVDERTKQLKQMNRKFIEDLEYARDIQKAMLPFVLPFLKEVSFVDRYFPAERVSGDFYNIFKLDDDNIGLYIGDVSGHGVPAAMLTVFAKQVLKTRRDMDINKSEYINPSLVLKNLNESFNNTNFKDEVYIALLYAIYSTKTMRLTYASAGMNISPLIIRASGKIEEMEITGLPICKILDVYPVEYENRFVGLSTGDKVIFLTDGLIEAKNQDGEYFSDNRLKDILAGASSESGPRLADIIMEKFFDFIGDSKLDDDITFFIMEVK